MIRPSKKTAYNDYNDREKRNLTNEQKKLGPISDWPMNVERSRRCWRLRDVNRDRLLVDFQLIFSRCGVTEATLSPPQPR